MSDKKGLYSNFKAGVKRIKNDSVAAYIKRPCFSLSGNREFFAEGHISVEKYGESEIILNVDGMSLSVCGRGMNMCFYNRHTVKLTGYITGIGFDSV